MKYILKAKKYGKSATVQTSNRLNNISIPKNKKGWTYEVLAIPNKKPSFYIYKEKN